MGHTASILFPSLSTIFGRFRSTIYLSEREREEEREKIN